MIFDKKYGIDLGSGSVKAYCALSNKTLATRNMVAYQDHTILAVGNEAYEMFEKTPAGIAVALPMAQGRIADRELEEILLYRLLEGQEYLPGARTIFFSAPPDMSALEKRAYYQVVNGHWLRRSRVFLVESPLADALGLGLDPETAQGTMLVNIGEQTTRFSILSGGKIIMTRLVPTGGLQINEAIVSQVRRRYNISIGLHTALRLKLAMGRLSDQHSDARRVVGIDSVSGLPREEAVSAYVVNEGIMNCMGDLGSQMKGFLERVPPQISYQVSREGIHLAGGSARIPYLDAYLASITGYTFNLSQVYENSALEGLKRILHEKELRKWASPIRPRKL